MATSYSQYGAVVDHVAGAAYSSGDIVVMANMVGVALTDIASGATGAVQIEGVFSVTKVAGEAWAQGDLVGWDATASGFDLTFTEAAGDVLTCGLVAAVAASGATTGLIKLVPGTAGS